MFAHNTNVCVAAIMKDSHGVVHIDLDHLHTNIIMVHMIQDGLLAEQFCDRLSEVRTGS